MACPAGFEMGLWEQVPADFYNFKIEQTFQFGKLSSRPFNFQDVNWHIKILPTFPSPTLQIHLENYEKSKVIETFGKLIIDVENEPSFWKLFKVTFSKNKFNFELFPNLDVSKVFKVTILMQIDVKNSSEIRQNLGPDFTKKHATSNVELRFIDSNPVQKLYCNMQLLRLNSKLFADFRRKKYQILYLDDKIDEFLELLKLIYPSGRTNIDNSNIRFLMELAAKYKMPHVFEKCKNAILSNFESEINLENAIYLIDKFQIPNILNKIMGRISEIQQIRDIEKSKFYPNFGKDTKSAISEKFKFLTWDLPETYELPDNLCSYWL